MTNNVQALPAAELMTTGGGDWDWGDFFDGATYGLGLGCYWTAANPVVCGAALVSAGIGLYL